MRRGGIEALLTFDLQPRLLPPTSPGDVGATPIEWPWGRVLKRNVDIGLHPQFAGPS